MKEKRDNQSTHVNLELDGFSNEILSKSAKRNNRTKRAEAAIRLKDHLIKYDQSWSLKDAL